MHNKVRFWLIALEVALTLAIIVNCVGMVLDLRAELLRPTGFDEENLLFVRTEPFGTQYEDETFRNTRQDQDLARLRSMPGAVDAVALSSVPLSGGGSGTSREAEGSDISTTVPYFVVTEGALGAIGTRLVAGRDFIAIDFEVEANEEGFIPRRNIIVSKKLAEKMFPNGDALGKTIGDGAGNVEDTIVGIVDPLQNFWLSSPVGETTMLQPGRPGDRSSMLYLVRTEAGSRSAVASGLEEVLLAEQNERIVTIQPLPEVKDGFYRDNRALVQILLWVTVLMVLVTSLGIVGLTSFSVTERTRQIGTRRALGATKGDILRYFLLENWLITGCGLALGALLAVALNYTLLQAAGAAKLDFRLLIAGMFLLWGTGVVAALAPALRATAVSPEIATRTV